MTLRVLTCILLLAPAALAQTTPPFGLRDNTPSGHAFTDATIIVSPTDTVNNGTLVIEEGHVIAVGTDVTIPPGFRVTNLRGKSIYPGLIEPFCSYGLPAVPKTKRSRDPQYEAQRRGADAWNDAIHAEKNWIDSFAPDSAESNTLLKLGFAAAQSAFLDGIFRGRALVTLLGDGLPNDLVIKPDGHHFGSFSKGSSTQDYPTSLMGSIALIRQTLLDVDWYDRAHSAWARNPRQERPEINRSLEALTGIRFDGIVFESGNVQSLLRAQRIADEFSVPMIHVGSGNEYEAIDDLKAIDAPLILPLNFPEPPDVAAVDGDVDVPLAKLRHWEWAPYNPALLDSAGIRFALTSHGLKKKSAFWKNLRTAIEKGLSRTAALRAMTVTAADAAGASDRVGTLEPGKLANFIITDGDLFDDSTTRYSIWIAGQLQAEFVDLEQTDFRGSYSLMFGDYEFGLDLSGSLTKLEGKISSEGAEASIGSPVIDKRLLSFTIELDTFALPGISRFRLRDRDSVLAGEATLPDGSHVRLRAYRIQEKSAQSPPDSAESPTDKQVTERIGRLTFPNKAFGTVRLPDQQTVLIKNATVWTCESAGIIENCDLLVRNGKIDAIGPELSAPPGAIVIDATGKQVTPGLIDEHSHVAIAGDVNEGTLAITSEVRIGDVLDPGDINMYRAVAGGTTAAHTTHGSANPIGGQGQTIKLRWGEKAENLKLAGAKPVIKFALGENVKQSNWGNRFTVRYPQTRMGVEAIIRDAFQAARQYEKDWTAFNSLSSREQERTVPPRRDLQLEALVEILNGERIIHCHAYVQSEILMFMRLAEKFGFRVGTFIHVLEGYKVADELAAHGAGASSFSDWWAYKFEVYDAIPQSPCLMHDRGVLTTVNSDSPELGRRLNQEAAKAVMHCGMDREDALELVTINAARQAAVDDRIGSLAPGKDADFVIWNGDPLSMYTVPEQTWIDGRNFFSIEQDRQRREDLRREKQALIQKAMAESSGKSVRHGDAKSPAKSHPPGSKLQSVRQDLQSQGAATP
jgi:imidazolonepropionase-like amidohydrolase